MTLSFRQFGRSLKPLLPAPIARSLKRLYHHYLLPRTYARETEADAAIAAEFRVPVVPPPAFRHRVHGEPSLRSFLEGGRFTFQKLQEGLALAGRRSEGLSSILDFGCGCGRTLLWWQQSGTNAKLAGTDIDAETAAWVRDHLHIDARHNQAMPPLAYPDASFDLLYCISVFTHLDENFQDAWFTEFQRIVKPGGILLISFHSAQANAALPKKDQERLEQQGILFYRDNVMNHVFPEFYQNAYHSPAYIRGHWGSFFTLLGTVPMGVQDLAVMQRK